MVIGLGIIAGGFTSMTSHYLLIKCILKPRSRIIVFSASASTPHNPISIPLSAVMEHVLLNESLSSWIPLAEREGMSREQQSIMPTLQNHIAHVDETLQSSNE